MAKAKAVQVENEAIQPSFNAKKFSLLNRDPVKQSNVNKLEKFIENNKKVENSKLGIKIEKLDEAVNNSVGNERRRAFTSGIITWDLQLAVRDRKSGNVIQIGDAPGVHVLYSKTSQGKTISLMTKVGQMIKNGLTGILILSEQDKEEELKTLLEMCGVDSTKVGIITKPDMESILTTVEKAIGNYQSAGKTTNLDFIVIDSLDTLYNKAAAAKGTAQDDMALAARRLSRFFQINHGHLCDQGVRLYIICQYRSSMDAQSEYSIENYAGGNALKHYAKSITYIKRAGNSQLRDAGERFKLSSQEEGAGVKTRGFVISAKLMKSKISGAIEGSTSYYDFYHMKGIDKIGTLIEAGFSSGAIEKVNTVTYQIGEKTFKGTSAVKQAVQKEPALQEELEMLVLEKLRFHNINFDTNIDSENDENVSPEEESEG